jgi:hypothetical protein
MRTYYSQPRRFNVVTAIMILIGLAAGYWLWRFFPAYWDGFTVDHILNETASATYRLVRLSEPERTKTLRATLDKARADIIRLGHVDDPDLAVNLDLDTDNNSAAVSADYSVVVTHPYIHKTTTLHFHKVQKTSIKRVEWE